MVGIEEITRIMDANLRKRVEGRGDTVEEVPRWGSMTKGLMMMIGMCSFAPLVQAFTAYDFKNQSSVIGIPYWNQMPAQHPTAMGQWRLKCLETFSK
jgi:hypothetical protein